MLIRFQYRAAAPAMLILACAFADIRAQQRSAAGQKAGEPEVTQADARAISTAAAIAATNMSAAMDFLASVAAGGAGPAVNFTLGNLYFQAGDYAAAGKAYESALEKTPDFQAALSNKGRTHLLEGRADEAVAVYTRILGQAPPDADTLILLGHALLLGGKTVSAEGAYRNALLLRPDDRAALLGLARCLQGQGRHAELAALCSELLAANPLIADFWALAANAEASQGRSAKAIVRLECARRLGIASGEMLAGLGDLYLAAGRPDDARGAYDQAFASAQPRKTRLLNIAEAFLRLGESEHAEALLKEASQEGLNAEERGIYLRLAAETAAAAGDNEAALERCGQWAREYPMDGEALLMTGKLRLEAGDKDAAAAAYETASRINGYEARALVSLARIEIERRNFRQALRRLESARAYNLEPYLAGHVERLIRLVERYSKSE